MISKYGFFRGRSLDSLAQSLRTGHLTSEVLVTHAFEAITALDPQLNAFVHVSQVEALKQARALDAEAARGQYRSPLHGLPVAIKDNIDTATHPTTYGSHLFIDHRPCADAECVRALRNAGAVIIGKTLTSEFALGPTGEFSYQGGSRNPHDISRVTGGSSAGSAAAVAAGMVPFALGTDTAGSIRIPASFCGVAGFKPSYGSFSMSGIYPVASSLDHIGIIANSAEDILTVTECLNIPTAKAAPHTANERATWLDCEGLIDIDDRVQAACLQKANDWWGASLSFDSNRLSTLTGDIKAAFKTLLLAEAYAVHRNHLEDTAIDFSAEIRERLSSGQNILAWEYLNAKRAQGQLQQLTDALFATTDLIVMPTTAITAPQTGVQTINIQHHQYPAREAINSLTAIWNLLGCPALSLPIAEIDGMPCGLQLVAAPGRDLQLLAIAAGLETR